MRLVIFIFMMTINLQFRITLQLLPKTTLQQIQIKRPLEVVRSQEVFSLQKILILIIMAKINLQFRVATKLLLEILLQWMKIQPLREVVLLTQVVPPQKGILYHPRTAGLAPDLNPGAKRHRSTSNRRASIASHYFGLVSHLVIFCETKGSNCKQFQFDDNSNLFHCLDSHVVSSKDISQFGHPYQARGILQYF